ncbi:MAG: 50S ribosomal protein L9 [Patescibacteria group bacterium]
MKVILLQDVAKIGKRSDVVEVPNGYALNQLIPKGMAQPATKQNQKRVAQLQAQAAQEAAAAGEAFAATVASLQAQPLQLVTEANEQGHLYQGLGAKEIATAAAERQLTLPESWVSLAQPIKEVGEHTVTLSHGQETADITVSVAAAS